MTLESPARAQFSGMDFPRQMLEAAHTEVAAPWPPLEVGVRGAEGSPSFLFLICRPGTGTGTDTGTGTFSVSPSFEDDLF